MKRILLCVSAILLISLKSSACALCGCSSSNNYLGVLPDASTNFMGLQYQYKSFTSIRPANFDYKGEGSSTSHEYYSTAQLWGRFYLSKRLNLFAFVPVVFNSKQEDGKYTRTQGVGDVSVIANINIVNTTRHSWNHVLQAGGGVKAPTGNYHAPQDQTSMLIPNMQAGTGSWDILSNVNYTIRNGNWGANADAGYTQTMPNAAQYKYGNRFNSGLKAVYWFQKKQLTVMPEAGVRYEVAGMDYDNYSKGWADSYTGGHFLFATLGAYAYYKKAGLHIMYSIPASQHYATGLVTAHNQFETGIYFLFNK